MEEQELTDKLANITLDIKDIFEKEKCFPCSGFYELIERLSFHHGVHGRPASKTVGKKICKLLDLNRVSGLTQDYYVRTGQEPADIKVKEDIEQYNFHSNAVKTLISTELGSSTNINNDFCIRTIERVVEDYCWQEFGNSSDDYSTNQKHIDILASRLSLPIYYSMETLGVVKGAQYAVWQIREALDKVKVKID